MASNYKMQEIILIELKNYSGKLSDDQISRFYFEIITNEQIYKCYNCKGHLNVILQEYTDNMNMMKYWKSLINNKLYII